MAVLINNYSQSLLLFIFLEMRRAEDRGLGAHFFLIISFSGEKMGIFLAQGTGRAWMSPKYTTASRCSRIAFWKSGNHTGFKK